VDFQSRDLGQVVAGYAETCVLVADADRDRQGLVVAVDHLREPPRHRRVDAVSPRRRVAQDAVDGRGGEDRDDAERAVLVLADLELPEPFAERDVPAERSGARLCRDRCGRAPGRFLLYASAQA
jgi:hypothetical protein